MSQPVTYTLKVPRFDDDSGRYYINKNWYIVRNDKNWQFEGPYWQKYFYSLNYVPNKCFLDPGFHEELRNAEDTKKKIIDYMAISLLFICTLSISGMPKYIFTHITKVSLDFFFMDLSLIKWIIL